MATLKIEVTPEEKSSWVRAAQRWPKERGPGLANWVIATLNEAASAGLRIRPVGSAMEMSWAEYVDAHPEATDEELMNIKQSLESQGIARIPVENAVIVLERV